MPERLDTPLANRRRWRPHARLEPDSFGKFAEGIARFMGTPRFLVYLTMFCIVWIVWNTKAPESFRFDSAAFGFTALTLLLSLQASYAAPLILLAQNRQADRDRVTLEQDRQRAERALADTEYLAREVASLRMGISEVATRDFVRSELRNLLDDLLSELNDAEEASDPLMPTGPSAGKGRKRRGPAKG
jgi:uncharacterized membrane protein